MPYRGLPFFFLGFLQILSVTAVPIVEGPSTSTFSRDASRHVSRQSTIPFITSVPDYALQYAPVMYLHSEEQWFPMDVKAFLPNVLPLDSSRVSLSTIAPTFASLSSYSTSSTYLSATSDITTLDNPSWLNSIDSKPGYNDTADAGMSNAPVEIIVAPKEDGIVDVFYFFFFAYNQGTEVLGTSFGDHLGDWEHTMIRFQDSTPTSIYLSQHNAGSAYSWDAILKTSEGRPTVYIGLGDHACYAMPGTQVYDDFLTDHTDAGTAWDVALNYRAYHFDSTNGQFAVLNSTTVPSTTSSASSGAAAQEGEDTDEMDEGVSWLTYTGYWGDKQFPDSDSRQLCVFGHCRFTDGPLGPYLKNLGRKEVCQDESNCEIQETL